MIKELTTLETDVDDQVTTRYWLFDDPVTPEQLQEALEHIGGRPDDRK